MVEIVAKVKTAPFRERSWNWWSGGCRDSATRSSPNTAYQNRRLSSTEDWKKRRNSFAADERDWSHADESSNAARASAFVMLFVSPRSPTRKNPPSPWKMPALRVAPALTSITFRPKAIRLPSTLRMEFFDWLFIVWVGLGRVGLWLRITEGYT